MYSIRGKQIKQKHTQKKNTTVQKYFVYTVTSKSVLRIVCLRTGVSYRQPNKRIPNVEHNFQKREKKNTSARNI